MPEVVLEVESGTGNASDGSDVNYRNTTNIPLVDEVALHFGNDTEKTPVKYGVACKWKPDTVPLNATLTGLSLEMMPGVTNNNSFTAILEVLALDDRLNDAQSRLHQVQLHCYMSTQLFSLQSAWADDRASGDTDDDTTVERYRSIANGIGGVGQAWTPIDDAVTRTLNAVYFKMRKVNSPSSDLVMTAYLYESTGAAGSRVRGDLVATSTSRTADELPTTAAPFVFSFSSPHTIETGVNYYTEVMLTGSGGAGQVDFRVVSTADGSTDNMEILSREDIDDRDLNGFNSSLYLHGNDIKNDTKVGAAESFTPPNFTASTLQEWGYDDVHEPILSPDQSLPDAFAAVATALGNRTDIDEDRIGVRIYDFVGSTSGFQRTFHSSEASTATRTSPDKFGMLMVLRWNEPQPVSCSGSSGTVERIYYQSAADTVDLLDVDGSANIAVMPTQVATGLVAVTDVDGSTYTTKDLTQSAAAAIVATGSAAELFTWGPITLHDPLLGSGVSAAALVGTGASEILLSGTGVSVKPLLGGDD